MTNQSAVNLILSGLLAVVSASATAITDLNQLPGSAFGYYGVVANCSSNCGNQVSLTSDTYFGNNASYTTNIAVGASQTVKAGNMSFTGEVDNYNANNNNISGFNGTVTPINTTTQTSGQANRANAAIQDAQSLFNLYTANTVLTGAVALTSGTVNVTANPGYHYNGESNEFVYTLQTNTLGNTAPITITAAANQYVIIDIIDTNGGNANFQIGNVTLSGGITSDHVLINFDSKQAGAQISTTSSTVYGIIDAALTTSNTNFNGSTLYGRLFCEDDNNNCQIVSNAYINSTIDVATSTPEPVSFLLAGTGLLLVGLGSRRFKKS